MSAVETTVDPTGLACPVCARELSPDGGGLGCASCERRYPAIAGIPDLQLRYEDAYVDWEEDLARARELAERFDHLDLAGLLREHRRRSGKPVELAERFLAGERTGERVELEWEAAPATPAGR